LTAHRSEGEESTVSHDDDQSIASRVDREKSFHDAELDNFRRMRRLVHRAKGACKRGREIVDFYDADGKVALDYGCGRGRNMFQMLERRARHVSAFDISEVRAAEAKDRVVARRAASRASVLVADGHRTPFADDSFDLVVGTAVLHHLDLGVALREVRRVLKKGGLAVFSEPLAHNPLVRLFRAVTPFARTEDEQPLEGEHLDLCDSLFPGFRHYEKEFLTIPLSLVNLVLPTRWHEPLGRRLAPLDDWLLERMPFLRRYARITVLVLPAT
jgi:SAM-dependent methyltransferase